ncbi:MAG: hypothetical protein ACRCXZ_06005 [Patescibacteria group bacterium]
MKTYIYSWCLALRRPWTIRSTFVVAFFVSLISWTNVFLSIFADEILDTLILDFQYFGFKSADTLHSVSVFFVTSMLTIIFPIWVNVANSFHLK